ncbi:histidine--tRNA ligase [Marasmitruncus massiliensis]|uniref:histidine--tRNA ligase n=1 Tax=Marasmitruncus massiliensis TaxID=1944642 RepID=UPI000C7BBC16|nr:histidine--tRNA ligase [Marasmitruncus massiliensis]
MAIITNAPRGTQDVLPAQSGKWQYVEQKALDVAGLFGFREIRFPTFEHTELFHRSVGDTTDVVQKEMYTFQDKGGRSITLRPEGTAGTMRAILQNGLLNDVMPLKVSYVTSCFRYEKPQAGRLREFHQFGVEMVGSAAPAADAQTIAVAKTIFDSLGITGLELEINSIGCPECRANYHEALKAYFRSHYEELCETCRERLDKNPMRILDCKNPACAELAKDAPVVLDYICDDCKTHFEGLKKHLEAMGIAYQVNPTIVRGLDYYTRTVFEFVATGIGAQGTVCGGGRYDGLIELLGGQPTPSIGFAMGLERLLLVMEQCGCEFPPDQGCTIYLGSMGEAAALKASELCMRLRDEGFYAECDIVGRSVKAQMKYADKLHAKYSCILGDNELEAGKVRVKRMDSGETEEVSLEADAFIRFIYAGTLDELTDETDGILGSISKIKGE